MKHWKDYLLTIVCFGAFFYITGCSREKPVNPNGKKRPIHVKVAAVKRGLLLQTLNYKGTVLPWKQARIAPEIAGRLEKVYAKPGDRVKKNQLLAQLDTTTLNLQIKQAEAALAVAEAALKDACLNADRLEKLFHKNAVSKVQWEKAGLAREAANTRKKSAAANLEVMRHTLENAFMKAPFDGIITSKNHDEGDIINPLMGIGGAPSVLTIMDIRKVKILLDVPATAIEKVRKNLPCRVMVESLPGETFQGTVYSKNLAADPASKTFRVEIEVLNPGGGIKAGVFADVFVETHRKENVLLLPMPALLQEGNITYVILYNNGSARYKNITVGQKNEHLFEVVEGLHEGQLVVSDGNYDLREKTPITTVGDDI